MDMIIKNGIIIDGTESVPFKGHLSLSGDRIKAVVRANTPDGDSLLGKEYASSIDAEGFAVAPGFIDAHNHFDWVIPLPDHEFLSPMVEQGVTTIVSGNCGFSPAPVNRGEDDMVNSFAEFCLERPLSYEWAGMDEFLDFLESQNGLLFNNVQLVGHGTVHLTTLRDTGRRPSPEELARVATVTGEALAGGAFGLSLGLMYPPGMYYSQDDLAALAEATAKQGKVLTVHKRALSRYSTSYPIIPFFGRPHNLRALEEMLTIGLETGVKLQISHFLFGGRKSWGTAEKAIRMIEKARERGLAVLWDIYPHFCGNSYLNVFLPPWFQEDLKSNLDNPKAVKRVKFELRMAAKLLGFNLSDIQLMQAAYPGGEQYEGMNMAEIGEKLNVDPIDAMLRLIRESDGKALQLTYGYSGDDENEGVIERMMAHECCLFETDTILKSSGAPNPASYGAFPRILGRFVREKKIMSLQEAISKMSGRTARWFGIPERGAIEPGHFADLVIFDPDTIADTTTRRETAQRPRGIEKVLMNGEVVVDGGRYLGKKLGRVIRSA